MDGTERQAGRPPIASMAVMASAMARGSEEAESKSAGGYSAAGAEGRVADDVEEGVEDGVDGRVCEPWAPPAGVTPLASEARIVRPAVAVRTARAGLDTGRDSREPPGWCQPTRRPGMRLPWRPAMNALPDTPLVSLAALEGSEALARVFGRHAPLEIEVGCGKGRFLMRCAALLPG